MINPDMQGKGQVYLQGEWQQNPDAVRKQLITYTTYHFKFECDSFYISIHTNSKVNYGADSCMRTGQWTEYTRGTYQQRNDTLYLKGQYCNPDYSLKDVGGCFAAGNYKETFKMLGQKDSLLRLSNLADVVTMDVHLIKRTVCHQKPL